MLFQLVGHPIQWSYFTQFTYGDISLVGEYPLTVSFSTLTETLEPYEPFIAIL